MGTAFDAWYPGYIDYAPIFKNVAGVLDRDGALPVRDAARVHDRRLPARAIRDLRPQSLYPSPWRPGWWRLGDAVDYMETASLAVLEYASKYKESLLFNRYHGRSRSDRAAVASEAPFAYVVPQEQRDPVAAVELLRRLAFGGVRVSQLTAPVTSTARRSRRARGSCRPIRSSPRSRAKCSNVQKYPDLRAVSRRSARSSVRRRRLDAAAADGRARRRGRRRRSPTTCARS